MFWHSISGSTALYCAPERIDGTVVEVGAVVEAGAVAKSAGVGVGAVNVDTGVETADIVAGAEFGGAEPALGEPVMIEATPLMYCAPLESKPQNLAPLMFYVFSVDFTKTERLWNYARQKQRKTSFIWRSSGCRSSGTRSHSAAVLPPRHTPQPQGSSAIRLAPQQQSGSRLEAWLPMSARTALESERPMTYKISSHTMSALTTCSLPLATVQQNITRFCVLGAPRV